MPIDPGKRFATRRQGLANMLMQQEQAAPPIQSHTQGLASMLRQGLAGYMQGQDISDRSQAYKTMMNALMQGDTVQEQAPPSPDFVGPMPAETISAYSKAAQSLGGLGTEYGSDLAQQMALADLQRTQSLSDAEQQRAAKMEDLEQELMLKQQYPTGGVGIPSDVQTAEWYMNATPEQKAAYDTTKRARQVLNLGGTLGVLDPRDPTGLKSEFDVTPKPEQMPEFKADVKTAEEQAKAAVELGTAGVKNQKAYNAFDIGMNSVEDTFANLGTDPVTGMFPAVTAKAQMAEGAVSAMAPILKSLFREAGEGVFTDKDQELLLNMAPKRTDHPEVVRYKTGMIRQIVAAKLGQGTLSRQSGTIGQGTAQVSSDAEYDALPSGAQFVGPDGQVRRKP